VGQHVVVRRPAALLAALPLLAECGGGDGEPEVIGTTVAGAEAITVVATDFAFAPSTIELTAGEPVTLTLDVQDGGHDLAAPDAGFRIPILDAPDAATASLLIEEPGTYTFRCNVPGHAGQGMTGTITVR
jgi:plastocyanin